MQLMAKDICSHRWVGVPRRRDEDQKMTSTLSWKVYIRADLLHLWPN
jgi:hypothetical protein